MPPDRARPDPRGGSRGFVFLLLLLLQQARQLKRRWQHHQSYVPCQDYFQLYIIVFVTQPTPPLKSPTSKFSCRSGGKGALGRKQVSNSVFYAQSALTVVSGRSRTGTDVSVLLTGQPTNKRSVCACLCTRPSLFCCCAFVCLSVQFVCLLCDIIYI